MPHSWNGATRISLVAVLVVVGAGCNNKPASTTASSGVATQSSRAARPTPTSATTAPDVPLLSQSGTDLQEAWYLQKVEDQLVQRCMTAAGLRYLPTNFGPIPKPDIGTVDSPPNAATAYGLYAKAQAGALGAGSASSAQGTDPNGLGAPSREPQDVYVQSLPASDRTAYLRVLMGTERASIKLPTGVEVGFPAGGCRGDARKRVYGSLADSARMMFLPQEAMRTLASLVEVDPKYVQAITAWKTCMMSSGFRFTNPQDAIVTLTREYSNTGAAASQRAREVAVARADARCDASSQLRAEGAALRGVYVKRLSSQIERDLLALSEVRRNAVSRAKSLVAPAP